MSAASARGWRVPRLISALVAGALALPAAAEGAPAWSDGAAWLPTGAPLYVAVTGAAVAEAAALAERLAGPGALLLGELRRQAAEALTRDLGFDPLSSSGLAESGLDAERPLWASAFAVDRAAVERTFRRRARTLARGAAAPADEPPFLRFRVVAATTSSARVRAQLARLAAALPDALVALDEARGATTAALARLFPELGGDRPARGARRAGVAALARLPDGVAALARLPDGAGAIARLRDGVLVVDLLRPFGGPGAPGALLDALAATAGPPPAGGGFAATLGRGARAVFTVDAAAAAYVDPARLAELGEVIGREQLLVATAGVARRERAALLAQGEREARSCSEQFAHAEGALLEDLGVALRIGPAALEARAAWGLSPLGRFGAALALADDRLVDVEAHDQALAAALFLGGTGLLADLPRHGPYAGDPERLAERVRACGPAAFGVIVARDWPQVAALFLDAARRDPRLGPIVRAARNGALVVRDAARLLDGDWDGLALLSLEPAAGPHLDGLLAGEGLRPRPMPLGGRALTLYAHEGDDAEGVTREVLDDGRLGLALVHGAGAARWFFGRPRPARLAAPPLGRARLDLPALVRGAARRGGLPAEARLLVDAVAARLGPLRAEARFEPTALVSTARVELR